VTLDKEERAIWAALQEHTFMAYSKTCYHVMYGVRLVYGEAFVYLFESRYRADRFVGNVGYCATVFGYHRAERIEP